jgi:hypothetical protein
VPVSDVTVWPNASWFVQQTVCPGVIVTFEGWNENPAIETAMSPASHGTAIAWAPDVSRSAGSSATRANAAIARPFVFTPRSTNVGYRRFAYSPAALA